MPRPYSNHLLQNICTLTQRGEEHDVSGNEVRELRRIVRWTEGTSDLRLTQTIHSYQTREARGPSLTIH